MTPALPWLRRLLSTPDKAQTAWEAQFRHPLGRLGYRIHLFFACAWCVACAGPASAVEILNGSLVACWVLRLPFVWRCLPVCLRAPTGLAVLAWLGWCLLSILWSSDRASGWGELEATRFAVLPLALWPVLNRRNLLIGCLALGFALAMFVQLAEAVGYASDTAWLIRSHPPAPDPSARISGWWQHPVTGGTMLVGALGMLAGVRWGPRPRAIAAGIILACVLWAAVLATGSRGALLSALVLTVAKCVTLVSVRVRARNLSVWKSALRPVAIVLGVVLAAGAALRAFPALRARAGQAQNQVASILRDGDYNSDVGGRVLAAQAAMDATLRHPIGGTGVGGFGDAIDGFVAERGVQIDAWRLRQLRHAHNVYLHAGATTGLVGLGLLLLTLGVSLRAGRKSWAAELASGGACDSGGSCENAPTQFAGAPLWGLVGVALAGMFDVPILLMSTAALLSTFLALCPSILPRGRTPTP